MSDRLGFVYVHDSNRFHSCICFAEMIQVGDLYEGVAKSSGSPIVVFNGELDRIRSGYYPALFFPKLGQLAKTFIPKFETAFYIHNFKGSRGGTVRTLSPTSVSDTL